MKIAIPWQTCWPARFVSRLAVAAVTAALLLIAGNLFAVNGPTNVVTITGGWFNNGQYGPYYGYVDGATNAASFDFPAGLALDPSGESMFIADCTNNAVRWISDLKSPSASWVYTFLDTNNGVSRPAAVAVDSADNVYVLNRAKGTNGYILEFSTDSFFTYPDLGPELGYYNFIATNAIHLTNATAMVLDGSANLYVTCNSNTVLKITPAHVSSVVGVITNAGADLRGVAVLDNGQLALTDAGNNGIWVMNPTNGAATKLTGFHGAGDIIGPWFFAAFNHPENIAKAGNGWLVVADRSNQKVKTIDSGGNVYRLFGVSSNDWTFPPTWNYPGLIDGPVSTFETAIPICVQAREPVGIVVAPDGSVYDTEVYYHVIRHATSTGLLPPLPWPPAPPTSPTATAGYGQVSLTWTASAGATNYNIYRTTGGPFSFIANTTTTTYADTNVLDGTIYGYVITASNAGGEGPGSGLVIATPLFSPPPILSVTGTGNGLISLAWTPSAGATSYNVFRSPSHGGPYTSVGGTNVVISTSYNDTSVSNGTPYYYVVTAVNPGGQSLPSNEVTATAPFPPVPNPQIGYITFPANTTPQYSSVFNQVSPSYEANNDIYIVIKGTPGSTTKYNYGLTTNASLVADPTAGSLGQVQSDYQDGIADPSGLTVYLVSPQVAPFVTFKAIGQQDLHPDSAVVTATFQFKTANPSINGNNVAQFTVSDITTNAQFWYTTDGSDPTNNGLGTSIGPVVANQPLSLTFGSSTNLLFKVRGFKANYQPSGTVSNLFTVAGYNPNKISFGFASGEASSDFIASPGQTFYAPVTLTTLPGTVMYSLQFNLTVTTNGLANPGPALGGPPAPFNFVSMLLKPIPDSNPVLYTQIPTYMFSGSGFTTGAFTNLNANLLGVGWLERAGNKNLYDTTKQTLITYSMAHDDMFPTASQPNGVIVGGYSFQVPASAAPGQTYQIQIGRPSATTDGIGAPGSSVFIAAPANGSLTNGAINAVKNVTIGSRKYLVGNVYPFRWFNAGDFGNTNLQNADVEQVFEAAVYYLNSPAWQAPGSDFFDAMDSCGNVGVLDGAAGYFTNTAVYPYPFTYTTANVIVFVDINTNTIPNLTTTNIITHTIPIYIDTTSISAISTFTTNAPAWTNVVQVATPYNFPNIYVPALFDGNDLNINQIAFGDGILDICDVYITYRRSLDTNSLVWFQRFWTNGVRVAVATNAPAIQPAVQQLSGGGKIQPALNSSFAFASVTNKPAVNFTAGDFQAAAGQQISIPITAAVFGPYPLRVAMLSISVVPLDGSPALTTPITFSPGAVLGAPTSGFTVSHGFGNYAAAWLNSAIAGLSNNAVVGTLNVTIPANATSSSAYAVHFDHASGSPNGLASLPKHTLTGLITLSSRNTSSYNDGIPDSWRLRWFGTVNNQLSVSNACPSGDGVNNWLKYVAGVDPSTPNNFPGLKPNTPPPSGAHASIYWPTVSGKQYQILSSASLFPGTWTTNATVTGNGDNMLYNDSSAGAQKFYRVQILP